MSNKTLNFLSRLIGLLQTFGGLWGIFFIIISKSSYLNYGLILGALVFIFCFASGLLLLFKSKYSIEISILNQLIQVFSFSAAGILLRYFTPLNLEVSLIKDSGLVLDFRFASKLQFSFNDSNDFEFVSINLLALFFLLVLNASRSTN